MNTISAIVSAPAAITSAHKATLLAAVVDDREVVSYWESIEEGDAAEKVAEALGEEGLKALEARVEKARANLVAAAEGQAKAAEAVEEQVSPREAAARVIESKDFDGAAEVAAALRGDMEPRRGAETLVVALRDRRVPGTFKLGGGPIRTAIAAAWAAHNAEQEARREAFKAQPAKALEAFKEFQMELARAARRGTGYATDQQIREAAARFFRAEAGMPPLVKALENLINAKKPNAVNEILRNDPELAAIVANADKGRGAGALINALQERARKDAQRTLRRRNGGAFGNNPYAQGKKSPRGK